MNPFSMPPRTIQSPRRVSGLVATLLAGLLLAGLPAAVAAQTAPAGEVLLEVKRFEIVGDNPLSAAETAATLAPFLGVHKSVVTLEAAATALENHLRDLGYFFLKSSASSDACRETARKVVFTPLSKEFVEKFDIYMSNAQEFVARSHQLCQALPSPSPCPEEWIPPPSRPCSGLRATMLLD